LAWDANSESNLAGYIVYYGTSSGIYTQSINVGNTVSATVEGLTVGETYYFTVVAYDTAGLQSAPSNQAVYTAVAGSGGGASSSPSVGGASATFVGFDTSTRGNWKGVYGTDGYSLAGDGTSYPSYATVTNTSSLTYTWAASTSDIRGLQKAASSTDRIAACWYTLTYLEGSSYTIDVNLTDGNSHQVGLYVVDWDGYGPRAETVQLTDATSGAVLETEALSSFQSGGYLVWTVQGHVKINVINNAPGTNAVASGLFFDPAVITTGSSVSTTGSSSSTTGSSGSTTGSGGSTTGSSGSTIGSSGSTTGSSGSTTGSSGSTTGSGSGVSGSSSVVGASASYVGLDTTTRGSWKGVYGADGYSLAGNCTSYPSYATVTSTGYLTYTWAASTTDVRGLQTAASSTARIAACWYTETYSVGASYTIDVNLTDGNSHQVGLYVVDWDGYGPRAETVQLTDANSGAVLNTETFSSFQPGGYLVWTVQGHVKINVINNAPGTNAVASGLFFDPLPTTTGTTTGSSGASVSGSSSAAGSSATFLGSDTSTRGSWKGVYGTDGYSLAGDGTSYPSYATVTSTGSLSYTWAASTTDVRGLLKAASSTARIAACWYTATYSTGASYTMDVNLTDGNSHQVGLYVVDWDGYGPRAETVQLTDAASGTVLDTETISTFQAGEYLVWTVRGHVKIDVINNAPGTNAVASGLFFDPATSGTTTGSSSNGASGSSSVAGASATYVGSDTSTRGSWKGVYGADGYSLAGDGTTYPSYATVTNTGSLTYIWAASTSDVRGLLKAASSTDRIAACWYTPTNVVGASYTIDVNLTDGNSHQVGLYVVDWDGYGPRAEIVQLTDATSGAVLDTETFSSFQAGGYLVWTVRGHVKINVINNAPGTNAVASGLFFDPAGTSTATP
jgi:hypothetical protein